MSTSQDRIARTPGVCGGKACIAGHRVRVLDIVVWHEHQGMTPDEIVSHVPTITLADVHAALAYYFDHVEEVRQEPAGQYVHQWLYVNRPGFPPPRACHSHPMVVARTMRLSSS